MREILQDATLELFLLLLKANTMDKQSRGGAEGGGGDCCGLRAKDLCNTNKTCAASSSSSSSHISRRRERTRDIFAKHLSHSAEWKAKDFAT